MRMRPLALAGAAILAVAPAAASASWGSPVRVSPSDRAAYTAPSVALGTGGEALAAWVRRPAGTPRGAGRVQAAARPAGKGGWSRPRMLSGPGAASPHVALNARGDAAAAWANGPLVVGAVRPGPDGEWAPGRVAETAGPVQRLAVAVDDGGHATVLWSERRGGAHVVRLATRASARAGWSVRSPRLSVPGPDGPALALSPGRGALAAWVDDGRVLAARTVRGAFERAVELSAPDAEDPGVALGPGGSGLTAWSVRLPGGTPVLLAAGRDGTGSRWGAAEDLGIGAAPVAALNDRGDAVVAWDLGDRGQPQGVEAATRRGRGQWRVSTVVPRKECDCALSVAGAAVDPAGTSVVSWRREEAQGPDGGGVAALARGSDDWLRPAAEPARTAGPPVVGAGVTRGALAAWAQEGPGAGVVVVPLR
jgi:hypothetical protein